ncbi:BspA family leucine-rich repeat surface protein [Companilactobacillus nodensis]|uniref:Lipoprotein n=1 Tax=Companilactobacillus nodensis DSM 19682 = JCM 14932 = NBRC 107160 TaxID=1423775 RepID=A0A0R1KB03_9LACO|nr:BspA family leucine-rich repeat surface protein [Companilactobacillus nodensis]KRK80878.1 hypothetical protein FD03_GL001012 [Companilactobacillus nodensis DSM 19682 = JCM 14932 = NBRC 107160]
MRFEQLKRQPNAILRKKLYKSGKSWVIASTLAFAGGMILLGSAQGTTVKADVTDGVATEGTAIAPSNIGETDGSNTETEEDSGSTKTEAQPSDANSDKGTGDSAGTTQDSTGSGNGKETTSNTDKTQAFAVPATGNINGDNTDTVQSDKTQQAAPVAPSDDTSINYGNVGANNDFAGSSWYINQGVLHIGAGTWGDINGFKWGKNPSKIESIYFDGPVTAGSSISGLFSGLTNLRSVGNMKGNFDTSKTTDFSTMFMNSGLTSFDFSILNMSNAIEISSMFENTNITSVNLSSINAPNLLNCSRMFANTAELKAANLSNFNFYSSDIQYMFTQSGLTSINLSGINTSNTKNDYGVFDGDTKLVDLDLSDFTMNTQTLEYGYNLLLFLGSQPADHVTLNDVKIHSLTLNPTLNLADSGLVFNTNLYKGWVSDKNPTADPISSEKLMSEYDGTNSPKEIQTWTLVKKDPVKPYNLTVNISYDDNPKKDTQLLILPGNPEDISNDSVFQSDLDKLPNNNQTLDFKNTSFYLSAFSNEASESHLIDFAKFVGLSDTETNLKVIINALVDLLKQQGMLSKGGDGSPINFVDAHYKTYEAPAVTPPVHNGGSSSNSSNSSATEPDREVDDVN